jgi:biopolymer transport protein ExbD
MRKKRHKKITLIPLMDIALILLIFFLLNVFTLAGRREETQIKMLVPGTGGEPQPAQVVIQLLDATSLIWWDENVVKQVPREAKKSFYLKALQNPRFRLSVAHGKAKLKKLVQEANRSPAKKYVVYVRVPDLLPIELGLQFLELVQKNRFRNITMHLLPGAMADIQKAKLNIVTFPDGRKGLRVKF